MDAQSLSHHGRLALHRRRFVVTGAENRTFIYPMSAGDFDADAVRRSFRVTAGGFQSLLGRVAGKLYLGRTSGGGVGTELDLDGDGRPDARFSRECGFLLQIERGRAIAVETDRAVAAEIQGQRIELMAHSPVTLPRTAR